MLLERSVDFSHNKVNNVFLDISKAFTGPPVFMIYGAVRFQLTYFSCDYCENMCTFYLVSSNRKNEPLAVVYC